MDNEQRARELASLISMKFAPAGANKLLEVVALLTAFEREIDLRGRLDENIIADTRVNNGLDLQMHRKRRDWLEASLAALSAEKGNTDGR